LTALHPRLHHAGCDPRSRTPLMGCCINRRSGRTGGRAAGGQGAGRGRALSRPAARASSTNFSCTLSQGASSTRRTQRSKSSATRSLRPGGSAPAGARPGPGPALARSRAVRRGPGQGVPPPVSPGLRRWAALMCLALLGAHAAEADRAQAQTERPIRHLGHFQALVAAAAHRSAPRRAQTVRGGRGGACGLQLPAASAACCIEAGASA